MAGPACPSRGDEAACCTGGYPLGGRQSRCRWASSWSAGGHSSMKAAYSGFRGPTFSTNETDTRLSTCSSPRRNASSRNPRARRTGTSRPASRSRNTKSRWAAEQHVREELAVDSRCSSTSSRNSGTCLRSSSTTSLYVIASDMNTTLVSILAAPVVAGDESWILRVAVRIVLAGAEGLGTTLGGDERPNTCKASLARRAGSGGGGCSVSRRGVPRGPCFPGRNGPIRYLPTRRGEPEGERPTP